MEDAADDAARKLGLVEETPYAPGQAVWSGGNAEILTALRVSGLYNRAEEKEPDSYQTQGGNYQTDTIAPVVMAPFVVTEDSRALTWKGAAIIAAVVAGLWWVSRK